jgi:hypothetical protein
MNAKAAKRSLSCRRRWRGASVVEYLVVLAVVGIPTGGALAYAGGELYGEFQRAQSAIASPVP